MKSEDKLPTPSEENPPQRPIIESEERSVKPTPRPHRKEENEK